MKDLEGQVVGKYELVRTIGEGNMGTVYLARDPFVLRDVAVKVASMRPLEDERMERRRRKLFFNEAKAAGRLRHDNIVTIFDAGIDDGKRYIAMEYVSGAATLDRFCRRPRLLPVENVLRIVLRCALTLAYAHEHKVVHRDIKPKNIMLTRDNEVKICDFGIALIEQDAEDTQVMGTLGSPRYMSPEQLQGGNVTVQSDIFSLGVVLYEMLTGVHPFDERTVPAIARRITRQPHEPVVKINPSVPESLSRIVDRTLKKHPAGRYSSAVDLAGDLSLIHDDIVPSVQDLSETQPFRLLKELSFFAGFEDAEIADVINAATWLDFERGDRIMVEGESAEAFYVVVDGEVVVRRGGQPVDVLGPGAGFGEVGLVPNPRRTATILARRTTRVLKVDAALLARSSTAVQLKFLTVFMRNLAGRLHRVISFAAQAAAHRNRTKEAAKR